jgi:hypothetical protein
MAISTTSTLTEVINAETIVEARLAFQNNTNLLPFVRQADITGVKTKVISFPVHATVAVSKTAEGTDQTTTATLDPTDVTLTVARRIVRVDLTDLAAGSWQDSIAPSQRIGQIVGMARAAQVDTDICGVMTTNYTSSVGATNSSDVAFSSLLSALLTLEVNEANAQLAVVLHPKQFNHLRGDLVIVSGTAASTDRSSQAQEAMNSGKVMNLFGAQVICTPRVGTGTDTNAMYLGFIGYTSEAIGYGVKNVNAELGLPDIELQRDASASATEVVHQYYDTTGIIRPSGLVLIKSSTY